MFRYRFLWLAAMTVSAGALAQDDDQRPGDPEERMERLRERLEEVREENRAEIERLEERLEKAEQDAEEAEETAEAVALKPRPGASSAPSDFNPQIGVVLNATAASLDVESEGYTVPGFQLAEKAGPGKEGLSLAETEINFQTAIDDKFYGNLTVALKDKGSEVDVGLDEAWFETTALPYGFKLRAGRFFSGIGYLNAFHRHADDFIDRPLPYQAFFAKLFKDDGVQARWIAPVDAVLVELGGEVLQGDSFPADADDGLGAYTLFGHVGGDIGRSHSWRLGVSYLDADVTSRDAGAPVAFSGDSDTYGVDFVYKWAPRGNPTVRNLKLQGEYFRRQEDGTFGGAALETDQHGYYVQGVYQFQPAWSAGYRFDALDADNRGAAVPGSLFDPQGQDPMRHSVLLEWSNSGFSRVRFQYIRDSSTLVDDDQFFLNYVMSFGAHRAHKF